MDIKYNLSFPDVPFSITNRMVSRSYAEDQSNPFSLLEFIKKVSPLVDSSNITPYYNYYLSKWNDYKNNKEIDSNSAIVEAYRGFIKDISLSYNSQAENDFLSNIDYNDPYDLDVALAFIGKKIKQIALYYSNQREGIKLETSRKKLKGSVKGITVSLKERILDILTNNLDKTQGYDLEEISKKLHVSIDELYVDNGNQLNKKPNTQEYGSKDRDYGLDIFLRSNSDLVAQIFGNTSSEFQLLNEADKIFDAKRRLTQKYMGTDYFYVSSTPAESLSGNVVYDSNFNIVYNREQIINTTFPPTTECKCFYAIGPASFSYVKCGQGVLTNITVPTNVFYAGCAYKGEVLNVNTTGSGSITYRNTVCTSVDNCTTPPTTRPPISFIPPASPPLSGGQQGGGSGGGGGGDGGGGEDAPTDCCDEITVEVDDITANLNSINSLECLPATLDSPIVGKLGKVKWSSSGPSCRPVCFTIKVEVTGEGGVEINNINIDEVTVEAFTSDSVEKEIDLTATALEAIFSTCDAVKNGYVEVKVTTTINSATLLTPEQRIERRQSNLPTVDYTCSDVILTTCSLTKQLRLSVDKECCSTTPSPSASPTTTCPPCDEETEPTPVEPPVTPPADSTDDTEDTDEDTDDGDGSGEGSTDEDTADDTTDPCPICAPPYQGSPSNPRRGRRPNSAVNPNSNQWIDIPRQYEQYASQQPASGSPLEPGPSTTNSPSPSTSSAPPTS
jgi:hypothetical protein